MYIVNTHGILHGWPDELALPSKHRPAADWEVEQFEATGQQDTTKMTKPAPKGKKAKDDDKPAA